MEDTIVQEMVEGDGSGCGGDSCRGDGCGRDVSELWRIW